MLTTTVSQLYIKEPDSFVVIVKQSHLNLIRAFNPIKCVVSKKEALPLHKFLPYS